MHASLILDTPTRSGSNPNLKYVDSTFYWVDIMGRLRPGVSRDQAEAAIAPIFRRFVEGTAVNDKERVDLPATFRQVAVDSTSCAASIPGRSSC